MVLRTLKAIGYTLIFLLSIIMLPFVVFIYNLIDMWKASDYFGVLFSSYYHSFKSYKCLLKSKFDEDTYHKNKERK